MKYKKQKMLRVKYVAQKEVVDEITRGCLRWHLRTLEDEGFGKRMTGRVYMSGMRRWSTRDQVGGGGMDTGRAW